LESFLKMRANLSAETNEKLVIRGQLRELYNDVYTPEVITALGLMSDFNLEVKQTMHDRIQRRKQRSLRNLSKPRFSRFLGQND